jgi:2-amino-4-hydroxy-6-hydroxymethyldihydropteridine diphosphokinase
MSAPVLACVGLGGNVGDAAASVRAALPALDALPRTRLLRASRLYRTPAWGMTAQPDFANAAALLETSLDARALLDGLLAIERAFGRERRERWGPRTLDLDLLLHGETVIDEPGLHVPHPHLHERAFALLPLADIAPDLEVPGRGRVAGLLTRVDAAGCVPLDE